MSTRYLEKLMESGQSMSQQLKKTSTESGGLNMADGMTEREFEARVIELLDLAKREGIVEGLRMAEKIVERTDFNVIPHDVVKAIRSEREKLEGQQC